MSSLAVKEIPPAPKLFAEFESVSEVFKLEAIREIEPWEFLVPTVSVLPTPDWMVILPPLVVRMLEAI